MLKGYIRLCRNAEGVHGKRKVGNPWSNKSNFCFNNKTWAKRGADEMITEILSVAAFPPIFILTLGTWSGPIL